MIPLSTVFGTILLVLIFRIVPSGINDTDKLDLSKQQQTLEEKINVIPSIADNTTVTNSNNLVSKQENHPKKNTNVLFDLAPKPSNTTKMIDVKAWDNLMRQKLEQTSSHSFK
jgi:hypothetical protein